MVCWIRRAQRLMLKVPADMGFERELMDRLDVDSHRELEKKLGKISDEELIRIFTELVKRRKARAAVAGEGEVRAEAAPYR